MLKKHKHFLLFMLNLVGLFLSILFISSTTVSAATTIKASDFNDGITNWQRHQTYNQVGQIPIAGSLSLGYSFGLASNTNNQIPTSYLTTGPDSTLETDSSANGVNLYYSKMNTFLNQGGEYISSVFQGSNSTSNGSLNNMRNVSPTSPDFMISPKDSNSLNGRTTPAFSVLGSPGNTGTGNTGLTNKQFFIGTDENGHPAYKIMGNFTRTNNSGYKNGTYNMEVELLLRASPTNSAIVQREMYVKNTDTNDASFVTLFGEDTKIGNSNNGNSNDKVPIYDLGNKDGLYISDTYNGQDYRLMVTNQTADGFDSYNGQAMNNNWTAGLSGGVPAGTGAEVNNNPKGTYLVSGNVDTAYILKWNEKTLAPGETAHFSSTIGVTAKPYAIPTPTKTYTNETRSSGVNKVGDKLKFTLKMVNNGYLSRWDSQQIVDQIPEGLQVDTSSIVRSSDGTTASTPSSSDYDPTTRKLTIPMPFQLGDDQSETVTFEATITNDALQNLDSDGNLTNEAQFMGSDHNISPNQVDTFKAHVSFPVQAPDYNFSFTKQVKNVTDNGDYADSITASPNDTVEYLVTYSVAAGSKDYLQSATTINDDVPTGLEVDKSSIQAKGVTGDWYDQTWGMNVGAINGISPGQSVQLRFKAKVTAASAGTITNNAYITGVKTTGNQSYDKQLTNDAIVNVKNINGFLQTPTKISFGTTNMYGKDQILKNVSTDGELIVAHPDSNDFSVNVAYDNNAKDSQFINGNGDTLPTDDSGLIFIRQRTNSSNDVGTWQPISPTGTPIQTTPFAGGQQTLNLTNYVGVNDWQLKLSSNTPVGIYNGTLTWTMSSSI